MAVGEHERRVPILAQPSAEQLVSMFETATIGIHAVAPDGTILWANEADHALLGYGKAEYVGRNIAEFHADPSDVVAIMACLRAGERIVDRRATLRHKDGSLRHVLIDSTGRFEDGKFVHTQCFTRDVTELRRREEREREDDSRLQQDDEFLTRATMQILEHGLDPDETLRVVSRLAVEHLSEAANVDLLEGERGLKRVVIAHKDPAKRHLVEEMRARFTPHPNVRAIIERIATGSVRVVNDIPPAAVERLVTHPDELRLALQVGYRHAIMVPMRGRSGLLGVLTLTRGSGAGFDERDAFVAKSLATRAALAFENARLHQTTRQLEAEWRSLGERYQRIIETAPAQVLIIDEEGTILSLNRSVRADSPKEFLGWNAFDTVVESDRDRVRSLLVDAIRSGKPTEYETQAILAPGVVRWFHVRVGPVEIDGKRAAILMSSDIDDAKRSAREIANMRAQLVQGEKLSALGSLVSGVAHELRTPLTFINNNTFLLERRLADAAKRGTLAPEEHERARVFLSEIVSGVDRIDLLVEDLRRYTKARHDQRLTKAPLGEVVADAIELFRATNRATHQVHADLRETRPVHVNVGSVQQIVLNLLRNAADATPAGGVLRVTTADEGDGVVLRVEDQGAGIREDVQARMFEPLFTTKSDGTGLGLSIVKRIVDEHDATIAWRSELGRGTEFRVRFPRAAA